MVGIGVRPDLEGLAPYVSPQRPGWTGHRMNTNESPYGPPPAAVESFLAAMRTAAFNRYPDRDATALLDALSVRVAWPKEGLWLANGSNEIFQHLFLAYGGAGRSALVFQPTYSLHTLIPRIAGTETIELPRDDRFAIDVDAALEALIEHRPEIVIVCSPNNPTGNAESHAVVETLLGAAPGLVVVDEAYGEFAGPEQSVRPLLDRYQNLVLVKTFSKAWSLAGARLGYLIAHPIVVEEMARVRLPYHLSTATQLLGEAVLEHAADMDDAVRKVVEERDRIATGMQAMGVKTYPSQANFVLFEVDEAAAVWQGLLDRGVLIRSYAGSAGLERCLRVTAGLPEETGAFLDALEGALSDV